MNIAIIGAANVGKALGSSFGKAGYHVVYAARSADSSESAARATGGSAAPSPARAARAAGTMVLPSSTWRQLAK